jgi:hypothetical protein
LDRVDALSDEHTPPLRQNLTGAAVDERRVFVERGPK